MSPLRPPTSRPSERIWFTVAGVLCAGAILMLLRPPEFVREAQRGAHRSTDATPPSKISRRAAMRIPDHIPTFPVRTWPVPADFVGHLKTTDVIPGEIDPFAPNVLEVPGFVDYRVAKNALSSRGVTVPLGSGARFDATAGKLEVHNTRENLRLIDDIVTAIGPMPMWTIDSRLFQTHDPPPSPPDIRIEINTRKLRTIVIPEVDFAATSFGEAIAFLDQRSRELDPEQTGVRLLIQESEHPPVDPLDTAADREGSLGVPSIADARIRDLRLRNVPLATVLQYMMDTSAIRYRIDPEGVTILALSSEPPLLHTRRWHVDPSLMERLRFPPFDRASDHSAIDPFAPDHDRGPPDEDAWRTRQAGVPLVDLLKDSGISFPPGTEAGYSGIDTTFTITNTPSNLDLAKSLFTDLTIEESRARTGH